MRSKNKLFKSIIACVIIAALSLCQPLESIAMSTINRSDLLEQDTPVILRVSETTKIKSSEKNGYLRSTVDADVYSTDGTRILIKAGTRAFIDFSIEPGKSWGRPGKICFTHARTRAIDHKSISLRLSNYEKGNSNLAPVIIISIALFPFGLFSGFMKGSMPTIDQGTTFNALVMQDVSVAQYDNIYQ